MKSKQSLSTEQVQSFLQNHWGQPVANVERIGEGWWSQAFAYTIAGVDYVARFGAYPEDFVKDKMAVAFASTALPVPHFVDMGEAFGEHFAIAERVHGQMIDSLDAAGWRRIVPAFLALLDAMRQVDISGTHGFGVWDHSGNAPFASWPEALLSNLQDTPGKRNHGWRASLEQFPDRLASFEEIAQAFTPLASSMPNVRSLVHTDLLNNNLLVSDNKISGVIDWGNALYGDFLWDLAHYALWSSWYPAMVAIDWETEGAAYFGQLPRYHERMQCYQLAIALDALTFCALIQNWEQFDQVVGHTLTLKHFS